MLDNPLIFSERISDIYGLGKQKPQHFTFSRIKVSFFFSVQLEFVLHRRKWAMLFSYF